MNEGKCVESLHESVNACVGGPEVSGKDTGV